MPDEKVEPLLRDLPDENGARAFLQRLADEHPNELKKLRRDPGLLSDALALAAWSPLLATTIEQNPDYLSWLARASQPSHQNARRTAGGAATIRAYKLFTQSPGLARPISSA